MSATRPATPADAPVIARLWHDFNTEFGDPVPAPDVLAPRVEEALHTGTIDVLLAGEPAVGFGLLSWRAYLPMDAPAALLEELYVAPAHRGRGLGGALLDAILALARERGAAFLELNTGTDDHAARALYASRGLRNAEPNWPDSPLLYYYVDL